MLTSEMDEASYSRVKVYADQYSSRVGAPRCRSAMVRTRIKLLLQDSLPGPNIFPPSRDSLIIARLKIRAGHVLAS